ncbi:hypothetical protein NCS57_01435300 [Fusarium keratoplasticum]|uniref:Uncharacterized protein n=1 Tax=Fusarium keratoplasticum TaxID=1328300 RepID=A0ACC0QF64_9HYPO|nr:hypothetical protein NCS57_01435300 [Fusarium keratoplasticum]KAI8650997.1 hypothetical protein NCS57_01435300 [Fusarium keratoplasticum]
MARRSLFAVATLAFGILGANAGPCRPATTVTSVVETSSTAVAETSSTTLVEASSTTVVESSSTTVAESSSTTLFETSTSLAESSSTTIAETSTTSEAPDCDTTQVLVNPSFDDDDGAPWAGIGNLRSDSEPRTGSHNLQVPSFTFLGGGDTYTFSQTLTNLNGPYRLSYYWRVASFSSWVPDAGFSCSVVPTVGTRQFDGVSPWSGPNSWTEATEVWTPSSPSGHVDQATVSFTVSCIGDFSQMVLAIDDVTFTEIKCEPLST